MRETFGRFGRDLSEARLVLREMGLRGPHGVGEVLLREIAQKTVLTQALEGLALALREGLSHVGERFEPREDAAKRRGV